MGLFNYLLCLFNLLVLFPFYCFAVFSFLSGSPSYPLYILLTPLIAALFPNINIIIIIIIIVIIIIIIIIMIVHLI